jgi:hypothetical protein
VLEVVAAASVTQAAPDFRWTRIGRESTPGSCPAASTVSAAIAVDSVSAKDSACTETTVVAEVTAAAPCQDKVTAR